jgi:hypothetical protein
VKAGLFATVIWVLWNNRNNRVWNNVAEPGRNLGFKAKQIWNEWYSAQNLQQGQHHIAQIQQLGTWQKPQNGWFKCNVDAGFHKELNKTSTGLDGSCSIVEGEALALIEALHAMEQRGIAHVIIETDSKSVVDAIRHIRGGSSEFSFLISQINNIMFCNPNFEVKFIKR